MQWIIKLLPNWILKEIAEYYICERSEKVNVDFTWKKSIKPKENTTVISIVKLSEKSLELCGNQYLRQCVPSIEYPNITTIRLTNSMLSGQHGKRIQDKFDKLNKVTSTIDIPNNAKIVKREFDIAGNVTRETIALAQPTKNVTLPLESSNKDEVKEDFQMKK